MDVRMGYEQLCNCIIRPSRCEYSITDLGPKRFRLGKAAYQRNDFELMNPRGLSLQCSHYEPLAPHRPREKLPCVIYLHGNCGSRLDGQQHLRMILPYDITLFTFDFSGCGLSQGEYISLGLYEQEDVTTVVQHLRASNSVTRIALWGRSMGAATSIMFNATDPSIAGIVLDSPFTSLHTVAEELVRSNRFSVPKVLISLAMKAIRRSIQGRAGFDIDKLAPIDHVEMCFSPALFVHGVGDTFILPHHGQELKSKYVSSCVRRFISDLLFSFFFFSFC